MTCPYSFSSIKNLLSPIVVLLGCFAIHTVHAQVIYNYAGSGGNQSTVGYWGDGGAAFNASTPYPDAICFDSTGNMYLTCVNSVRKVDVNTGIISLVAGNGTSADSGDSGLAVNASMKFPDGLCLDKKGNLYIAEYSGHRVRKIDLSTGIITTVAGNGTQGTGGDNGPATQAQLDAPEGICVDETGNLYIADIYSSRIRKVDHTTGVITTLISLDYPNDIAIDRSGNLYICQTSYIRKYDFSTGTTTIVAGNGMYEYSGDGAQAVTAGLFDASGVAVDDSGNVYISEYDDSRIRKVDHRSGIITTIAGNGTNGYGGDCGPVKDAILHNPKGLAIDMHGDLYICDNQNNRIRKISPGVSLNPTVKISTTEPDALHGIPARFVATVTNAGVYQYFDWKKNGVTTNVHDPVYTDTLVAGDTITCDYSCQSVCSGYTTVMGNRIIKPLGICTGEDTVLVSSITGNQYQWFMDSGSGYVEVPETESQSGTRTRRLKLKNVSAGMAHYSYYCTTENGVSSTCNIKLANTWTGAIDSKWENPLNWSCGHIPGESDDLIIYSGDIVIASNAACRSISVRPGASVTVKSNFGVKVADVVRPQLKK